MIEKDKVGRISKKTLLYEFIGCKDLTLLCVGICRPEEEKATLASLFRLSCDSKLRFLIILSSHLLIGCCVLHYMRELVVFLSVGG